MFKYALIIVLIIISFSAFAEKIADQAIFVSEQGKNMNLAIEKAKKHWMIF